MHNGIKIKFSALPLCGEGEAVVSNVRVVLAANCHLFWFSSSKTSYSRVMYPYFLYRRRCIDSGQHFVTLTTSLELITASK